MHIMVPLWEPTVAVARDNGCRGVNEGVSTVGGCAVRLATLARPYG